MLTEIYVSIDGLTFTKLDLFKDEPFVLNQNKKDLQNISKVFSPFSQSFSFPATPKNKKALGFFGSTQAIKINPDNKFKMKFYTNGIINQTGILTLESVKFVNQKATTFIGGFSTNLLSLADRIGNDMLSDLSTLDNSISLKPNDAIQATQSVKTINDINYYIPLISNNRVWNYDTVNDGIDNIAYRAGINPNSDRVVNFNELRPAVSMLSLFNLLKANYNLDVTLPLLDKPEFKEAFIWCNGQNFNSGVKKFALTKQFDVNDLAGFVSNNLTDSSTKLTIVPIQFIRITYRIQFKNVTFGDNETTSNVTISIVRKSTLETVLSSTFEFKSGITLNEADIVIPKYLFEAGEFEFFTYVESEKPMFWKMNTVYLISLKVDGEYNNICIDSYNSDLTALHKADIIKSLPAVKTIDFLNSLLKTFNISIYDNSPTNENISLLTPIDIDTPNKIYSKRVVDFTRYANVKEIDKKTNNPYNYYNFKHKTSKYKSNSDFKKQFNIEYGQTFFPSTKPTKANEFKVETEFSIIPPVKINGCETFTAYGFTSDKPEVSDTGKFRYTPNLDEMTIFYNHGATAIEPIAIQRNDSLNIVSYISLSAYLKSMPYCKQNNQSFAFSVLKIDNVEYSNNLFLNYYQKFIQRLLNPNALSQQITFNLPPTEIYLNDANVTKNAGLTPKGFRMQNEIIVGETRYEILDSQIDLTTGKAKLTLLNF